MSKAQSKTFYLTSLAFLTALILIMSFTPLGYLKFGITSITLLPIPIAVGAILLGPVAGGFLGAVFGLTSFYQCFGADAFGVFLMSLSPWKTAVLCIVPRILFGLCTGLLAKGLSKIKSKNFPAIVAFVASALLGVALTAVIFQSGGNPWMYLVSAVAAVAIGVSYKFISSLESQGAPYVVSSCAAAVLNTAFFVSALVLLFGKDESVLSFIGVSNIFGIVIALVTVNAVIECAVCLLAGTVISRAMLAVLPKLSGFKRSKK